MDNLGHGEWVCSIDEACLKYKKLNTDSTIDSLLTEVAAYFGWTDTSSCQTLAPRGTGFSVIASGLNIIYLDEKPNSYTSRIEDCQYKVQEVQYGS